MLAQGQATSSIGVTSLTPTTISVGSGARDLVVRGKGFSSKSQVRVKGEHRATTFVSSVELRAKLVAADVATAGSSPVTVFTPGAGNSNAIELLITGSTPSPVAPPVVPPADTVPPTFTTFPPNLTVAATSAGGTYVAPGIPQAVDNSGIVTVTSQPPGNISTLFPVGTTSVLYTATDPSGNKATLTSTVTVTPLPPAPTMTIVRLDPPNATPGALGFSLAVRGTGYVNGMIVRWNGSNRTTTFHNSETISATITAADIVSPGQTSVSVFNPVTGAATPPRDFFVDASRNGVPRITSLGGSGSGVAGTRISFAVNGTGFVPGSIVRWNGADLPATAVSLVASVILGTSVPSTMTAVPGIYRVTVFNPGPNGGESNAVQFTLTPP